METREGIEGLLMDEDLKEFIGKKQEQIENSTYFFLNYVSENERYTGPLIQPIFCMYDEQMVYYVRNNELEKIERALITEDKSEEIIRSKKNIPYLGMGIWACLDDSYFIQNYLKNKCDFKYCAKSNEFKFAYDSNTPMNSVNVGMKFFVFWGYQEKNSFLKYLLSQYGDVWINDGMGKFTNFSDPVEVMSSAVKLATENMLDLPVITNISSLNYEGEKCKSTIGFARAEVLKENKVEFSLGQQIKFNLDNCKSIRKLLQLTGDEHCLLINYSQEPYLLKKARYVEGIGTINEFKKVLDFYVNINGYLNWTLYENINTAILKFSEGRYMIPAGEDGDSLIEVKTLIAEFSPFGNKLDFIIDKASKQLHGTTIIISEDAKREAERLSGANRGYSICGNDHKALKLLDNLDIIYNITNIDGAIIIDFEGFCYAIGVILDGDACISGDSSRGARFNSAKNYIALKKKYQNEKYAAIVFSEDRYVNVFTTNEDYDYLK